MLGCLYYWGKGGVAQDHAAAVSQFQLAAARCGAEHWLGLLYRLRWGIAHDDAVALRWLKLVAAQGLSETLHRVDHLCCSVAAGNAEAIRWYKRAQAAGKILRATLSPQVL